MLFYFHNGSSTSSACVKVNGGMSKWLNKWFEMSTGVHQGCVISPWLFHVCTDEEIRETEVRWSNCGVWLDYGSCLSSCMQIIQFCWLSQKS